MLAQPVQETAKPEKQIIIFTVRIPNDLLKKWVPKGFYNSRINELIEADVAASGKKVTVNYDKLKQDAEDCRKTMETMIKILNSKMEKIQSVVCTALGEPSLENLDAIIELLTTRKFSEFNRGDVERYIEYLEEWKKHEDLLRRIDEYRKTVRDENENKPKPKQEAKVSASKRSKLDRYIPPELLCPCGLYETREEHNARVQKERGIDIL
jgi:ATP-dependent helicase YprA (DUF1998 family)